MKNEEESAEILIYGQISDESWFEDDVTPKQFASDLKAFDNRDLTVRINSLGGDVFAAQAIYNQLKSYGGKVNVLIDGICASAATIIACAGDTVSMPNNSIFMIHNPATILIGAYDAPYLEKVSNALSTIKETIINVYLSKTDKLNAKKISKMMDEETYMSADTAKNYGFIDEICGKSAKIENKNGQIYINSLMIDTRLFKKEEEFQKIINEKVKNLDEKTLFQNFKSWLNSKMSNEDDEEDEKENPNTNDNDDDSGETDNKKTAKAVKNAILEERKRIAALDALKTGNVFINKFIDEAKLQGDSIEKVKAYVTKMSEVEATPNKGIEQLKNLVNDNLNSGADGLKPNSQIGDDMVAQKEKAIMCLSGYMNEIRGMK